MRELPPLTPDPLLCCNRAVAEPASSIVERNLRAAMKFFGQASGVGDVTETKEVLLIDSGVNYSVFNIAMLTCAPADIEALSGGVRAAARYYKARQTRWSIWICEDSLSEQLRRLMPAALANQRMHKLTEAPGMIAERLRPPLRRLPKIDWLPVNNAATRSDFSHITSVNFDIPFATCQLVYGNEQAWSHDYHGFVAYADGMPVATTAVVMAAGAIGIYSVSTLPQYRRRGYAEALMRCVIEKYRAEAGTETTVLQATRSGYDMYLKMGYRPVSRFIVYMT
jgi:GNAT superfamily N-acetyltransferase